MNIAESEKIGKFENIQNPQTIFAVSHIKKYRKRNCWKQEHFDCINMILKAGNLQNWALIAKELNLQFPEITDSGKKCEERWRKYVSGEQLQKNLS